MNNELLMYLSEYKTRDNELIFKICPFCNGGQRADKYKFFINQDKGTYICHRGKCGEKGHISELYKKFGIEYKRDDNMKTNTVKKPVQEVKKVNINTIKLYPLSENDKAYKYLQLRKIKKETLDFFKVSKDKKGNIVFPFYKNNKLKCIKYRIPDKVEHGKLKTWQEKGGEAVLFNGDNLDWTKPIIISEGEIDCMSVWQSGKSNVGSIPFGVNNFDWVDAYWDKIEKCPEIIVLGDNDEAGEKFINECSKKFGINKIKIVKNKYNDINLLHYKDGEEAVKNLINTADFIEIDGLIKGEDVPKYKIDLSKRINTGFNSMNSIIGGFLPGTLTILSGKRGQGKSTLAGQFLIEAIADNKAVCVYSGELTKELFKHWLFLQISGIHVQKEYDKFRQKEVEFISDEHFEMLNEWIKNKLFIYDNTVLERKTLDEASILQIFKYAASRHNCQLFLFDNLMTAKNQYARENFYRSQGEYVGTFKQFANDFGTSVIFVAHPKKTQDNKSNDFDNDDISGSGEISDGADTVIAVQKLKDEERAEYDCSSLLHISKNRLFGDEGTLRFNFNPDCKRFIEVGGAMKDYVDLNKTVKKEKLFEDCPF